MTIDFKSLGISKKTRLIVGVSGGPDSVALLHLLKQSGFKNLVAVHLDHGIRKESPADRAFVEKLCRHWKVKVETKRKNILLIAKRKKENLEAVARSERYGFLRAMKKKHRAQLIVTAHHANDQVETVLMNMIRGCGLDGLSGMKSIEGDLARPLLGFSKKNIHQYCRRNKLPFVHDHTNDDPRYTRNFLRHEVIPLLAKFNANLVETFSKNIRLWTEAANFFEERAKVFLEENRTSPRSFGLKAFKALDLVEQQVVLRRLFQETHGHKKNLSLDHINQILSILQSTISGKKKEFGPGKMLMKKKDSIFISSSSPMSLRGARLRRATKQSHIS